MDLRIDVAKDIERIYYLLVETISAAVLLSSSLGY
jgi:hypothetical protein